MVRFISHLPVALSKGSDDSDFFIIFRFSLYLVVVNDNLRMKNRLLYSIRSSKFSLTAPTNIQTKKT